MKLVSLFLLFLGANALAQDHSMHMAAAAGPEPLWTGLGPVHHKVSTENGVAQQYFDQGLALDYAFNHHASERSFKRAQELDPKCAMAYWGEALALGPNINSDMTPDRETQAFAAIQKAKKLAGSATSVEQGLITALAARYTGDANPNFDHLSQAYANAMGRLYKQFSDDDDVATLYAEAKMDLHPWHLWSLEGKPTEGTTELIDVLKRVLARNPDHVGANHFYVHAVEASPHPEDGLDAAHKLEQLAPNAGHLVHMPSHIFIRTGDYERGVVSNEKAIEVDKDYLARAKATGIYPMYVFHNFDMLRFAANMEGNYKKSQQAVTQSMEVGKHMKDMPTPPGMLANPCMNEVRFRKWKQILAEAGPDPKNDPTTNALEHFARGMAYAGLKDLPHAKAEQKALASADALDGETLGIARQLLKGKIEGLQGNSAAEIKSLQKAVDLEDGLRYDEPPPWCIPCRESLGGAYLRAGQPAKAEAVFRADLLRNRGNGRSLFGLWKSLAAQNRTVEAAAAEANYRQAWKYADTTLTVEEL